MVEVDKDAESGIFLVPAPDLPAKRIIFAGTGPLDKDYDDVRRYYSRAHLVASYLESKRQ